MTHRAFDPDRTPDNRFFDDPPDPALDEALQALAPLRPARDLWPDIAARLDAPRLTVVPGAAGARPPVSPPVHALPPRRRWLAAAAVALMAVSSGATYLAVRGTAPSQTAPSQLATAPAASSPDGTRGATPDARYPETAAAPPDEPADRAPDAGRGSATDVEDVKNESAPSASAGRRYAATAPRALAVRADRAVDTAVPGAVAYDREIAELRSVVADRHRELDSATVAVLARNLQIIDAAIAASRAALARDPHSPFLGDQLTRALGQKVELLRTAALLPRT